MDGSPLLLQLCPCAALVGWKGTLSQFLEFLRSQREDRMKRWRRIIQAQRNWSFQTWPDT